MVYTNWLLTYFLIFLRLLPDTAAVQGSTDEQPGQEFEMSRVQTSIYDTESLRLILEDEGDIKKDFTTVRITNDLTNEDGFPFANLTLDVELVVQTIGSIKNLALFEWFHHRPDGNEIAAPTFEQQQVFGL